MVAVLAGSATLYFRGGRPAHSSEALLVETEVSPRQTSSKSSSREERTTPVSPISVASITGEAVSSPRAVSAEPQASDVAPAVPPTPVRLETAAAPRTIGVAAMGAVRKPGLYMMPDTYRVADLIALAGGAAEEADLSEIALTAALIDETTLTIPEKSLPIREGSSVSVRGTTSRWTLNPAQYLKRSLVPSGNTQSAVPVQPAPRIVSGTVPSASPAVSSGGLINLNQATSEQLQQLPGIGPVLAGAIIAERERQPFTSVEDLDRVHGIGEKRLAAVQSLVTAP